jgi:uncharacterized protein (TIGR02118 family)
MRKIVAALHAAPDDSTWASAPGVRRVSLHTPYPDAPAEQPDDVGAIAMVWTEGAPDALPLVRDALAAYAVDERVQWDYERDWPDGTPSPGVKRLSFVRRVPTIDHDEFARHWSERHAPLARVHHPGIWRYVQNVVVEPLTDRTPELDGVAELHFRTYDDLQHRMYDSDEGKEIIRADVRRFLDAPAGWRMLAVERIVRS